MLTPKVTSSLTHIYKHVDKSRIQCYNIEHTNELTDNDLSVLTNLIGIKKSYRDFDYNNYVEYGPYAEMVTPWCSNAMNILKKCNVHNVTRIELSTLVDKHIFNEKMIDPMTQMIYDLPIQSFTIQKDIEEPSPIIEIQLQELETANQELSLGFDEQDLEFYRKVFTKAGRNPTNIELHDLAQSNSEHSRHWFFNGQFIKNKQEIDRSLMDMIKGTLNRKYKNNSTIAFSDNSSAIRGYETNQFAPNTNKQYQTTPVTYNPVFTAETHNFPTSIAPFPGAATGTGGRIRDNQSVGQGGLCIAGLTGYSVGNINEGDYIEKNVRTLIEASNGASDYGNKFGEPVIQGFCRSYGSSFSATRGEDTQTYNDERIEYVKPIMFSAGIGQMNDIHTKKETHLTNDILVVRLGGPAYRIGIGGGTASSRDQHTKNKKEDFNAVQRGDPEMENKLGRVIRDCIELGLKNPILSIHDQGAGGMANVTKEIVHPNGAKINLKNVVIGDHTMSTLEIWISEHQEQDTILIHETDKELVESLCLRENLPMAIIGQIDNSGHLTVINKEGQTVVDFDLQDILGKNMPRKKYILEEKTPYLQHHKKSIDLQQFNFSEALEQVLQNASVCSKRFLVNKVDRSVTGLIAQQQCCGPLQTPLADFSVVAQSCTTFGTTVEEAIPKGMVTAIGERPIIGLINPEAMVRMSIGEMLTNMMFCKIDKMEDIRCSGNWMWPLKMEGEKDRLYRSVKAMCDCMNELDIALDGGKDSLSMSYHDSKRNKTIKSPGTLVISGYTTTKDITKKVTPDFKQSGNHVYYLNLSGNKYRLGGSILHQEYNVLPINPNSCPDFENYGNFKYIFNMIQELVNDGIILSGHDVSDGGFITSLLEMCFAGNLGLKGNVDIKDTYTDKYVNAYSFLFAEELGVIFEVEPKNCETIEKLFNDFYCYHLGTLHRDNYINLMINNKYDICDSITHLRQIWEYTSYRMDLLQTNKKCVKQEYNLYEKWNHVTRENFEIHPKYDLNTHIIENYLLINQNKPKVVIIREEGSNGDREMASAFYTAGFDVYDICMNDFINNQVDLNDYQGIAFVGGFSYSDVFGAARGWYQVIISNPHIKAQFDNFYKRSDTFSLGVCNGCQLMSLLGWIPSCQLKQNKSKRFESRFNRVKINKTNSIMLKGIEDSILGIWSAHGEGRFVLNQTVTNNVIPLQYVNEKNKPTQVYPHNPNGSELGIAALCSPNGRHLAMMPHPERCYLNWQKPINSDTSKTDQFNSWFLMFRNAYEWTKKVEISHN
jgi:phosphoribosylformylglycinamidine synthase